MDIFTTELKANSNSLDLLRISQIYLVWISTFFIQGGQRGISSFLGLKDEWLFNAMFHGDYLLVVAISICLFWLETQEGLVQKALKSIKWLFGSFARCKKIRKPEDLIQYFLLLLLYQFHNGVYLNASR